MTEFDPSKAIGPNGELDIAYCASFLQTGTVTASRNTYSVCRRQVRARLFHGFKFFKNFDTWREELKEGGLSDYTLDPTELPEWGEIYNEY